MRTHFQDASEVSENEKNVSLWGKVQSKIWQQALTEANPALNIYLGHDGSADSVFMHAWEQGKILV